MNIPVTIEGQFPGLPDHGFLTGWEMEVEDPTAAFPTVHIVFISKEAKRTENDWWTIQGDAIKGEWMEETKPHVCQLLLPRTPEAKQKNQFYVRDPCDPEKYWNGWLLLAKTKIRVVYAVIHQQLRPYVCNGKYTEENLALFRQHHPELMPELAKIGKVSIDMDFDPKQGEEE